MKLIYLSESIIPSNSANSVHVMKMCNAFVNQRNRVILFARNSTKNNGMRMINDYNFYGIDNIFKIKKLKILNYSIFRARDLNISAFFIKKYKPNLIYSRSLIGNYIASKMGYYNIIEMHHPLKTKNNKFISIFRSYLFNKIVLSNYCLKIIVISKNLKKIILKNQNIPENKFVIAHDGADIPKIKNGYLKKFGDKLNVGYVGHLYKGRGVNLIIKMAKSCSWANFNLIGGTKEDVSYWKKKSQNLKNITFYGFKPYKIAEKLRIKNDVLIAPYQNKVFLQKGIEDTSKWMSPLKIFEYMASKRPIITSNLRVIREVLTHKKSAILCDPNDISEWIFALKQIYNDIKFSNYLARNAFEKLSKEFTWDARVKKILILKKKKNNKKKI